ncbi:MAG TPA: RES family NAD+ phosphorylase [Candidatus Limnocylindrales bacterium]|nr:RES family NAD+ phosphorylase [Candidatus Limnocylindrales bacterium]
MARVYRCIGARRWDSGDPMAHVPPLELPAVPGRWNDSGQYTLYTSHRAAVAIEEKRRHLARSPRSVVGSILVAIGDPPATEVVVLSFEPPATGPGRTFDGATQSRDSFDRWLAPCGDARAYAARLIRRGCDHLVVPSSPCPNDWNSVFYFLGPGQPVADGLPRRAACRVTRRARVTSTEPDCPPAVDRRRRVTIH